MHFIMTPLCAKSSLRILIICVAMMSISAGAFAEIDVEGPVKPSCAEKSPTARFFMPLLRISLLDASMYAGLVALWPHAFSPEAGSREQMKESWTSPPYMNPHKVFFELDDDPWVINTVLHGIYGSEVWMAARSVGYNGAVSFGYALFASTTWEYLVEGWFHRPSAIDLAWTPVAGAVLGEFRYQLISLISRKVLNRGVRLFLTTLLDPVGRLERFIWKCSSVCEIRQ